MRKIAFIFLLLSLNTVYASDFADELKFKAMNIASNLTKKYISCEMSRGIIFFPDFSDKWYFTYKCTEFIGDKSGLKIKFKAKLQRNKEPFITSIQVKTFGKYKIDTK